MARRVRIQFPGAAYHVQSRGDRGEPIFQDDADRTRFLHTMAETGHKAKWQIHAFALRPNSFHLLLTTPEGNLVDGMKWFLGTYTTRFNCRHKCSGHLFAGRYQAVVVEPSPGYLRQVADYIHLDSVRAGLLALDERLRHFPWSSFAAYVGGEAMPDWLHPRPVLESVAIDSPDETLSEALEREVEHRRSLGDPEEWAKLGKGWFFGSDTFREQILLGHVRPQKSHYGEELSESQYARAEEIIRQGLTDQGWTEDDLGNRPKGHPVKLQLASTLRERTTTTLEWIASRLNMGTRGHIAHLLYWHRRGEKPPKGANPRVRKVEMRNSVISKPRETMPTSGFEKEVATIPLSDPVLENDGSASALFDTSFD